MKRPLLRTRTTSESDVFHQSESSLPDWKKRRPNLCAQDTDSNVERGFVCSNKCDANLCPLRVDTREFHSMHVASVRPAPHETNSVGLDAVDVEHLERLIQGWLSRSAVQRDRRMERLAIYFSFQRLSSSISNPFITRDDPFYNFRENVSPVRQILLCEVSPARAKMAT